MKIHSFQQSLKKGKRGEAQFLELFADLVEPSSGGFMEDFKIKANGKKIELKMDNWCPTKTENFAMERFSYDDKPGGPYQSLDKGIDYFIYFFPKAMQFHVWETKTLVARLAKVTKDLQTIPIFNVSHVTKIHKVPRHLLADIELDLEKVLKGKI